MKHASPKCPAEEFLAPFFFPKIRTRGKVAIHAVRYVAPPAIDGVRPRKELP
jgi:hypothetical protein